MKRNYTAFRNKFLYLKPLAQKCILHFNDVYFFHLLGPSGIDIGYGVTQAMSCECCPDHTAVLTAFPFHQHVVVQQGGDVAHQSTSTATPQCMLLHPSMGSET
jgi:hypothetical protein